MISTNYFRKFCLSAVLGTVLTSMAFASSVHTAAATTRPNAVYVLTNETAGNAVAVFNRAEDGSLTPAGSVSTGGLGSGGGLGTQGALVLSENHRWLFAVNPGSNDVSVFAARPNGLQLVSRVPSGGLRPISLTVYKDWLYVPNGGGSGNIAGFEIDNRGQLTQLPGATRHLSNNGVGDAPGPAQVSFNPSGDLLVVTEKATNLLDVFSVDDDGIAGSLVTHPSAGMTPFGFAFDKRGTLVVSEAFGGAANASAVSTYDLWGDTDVAVISPSVPTLQSAACWVVVSKNSKFVYTTNTGSDTISGYRLKRDGTLSLLNANGITATTGDGPIDFDFSGDGRFLYTLNGGSDSISVHRMEQDGSLTAVQTLAGLAASAVGLAAR